MAHIKRRCEACDQYIVFLPYTSKTGKKGYMPINAESIEEGDEEYDRERHITHWGTCPHAERFR